MTALTRCGWALLSCALAGCSTHPLVDLLDAIHPGTLGKADVQPYGGVCISQGAIQPPVPMGAIPGPPGAPQPVPPGGGVVPPPVPLPGPPGNLQLLPPTGATAVPPPPPPPPAGLRR